MEKQIKGFIYGLEHGMSPAWTIGKVVEMLNKFHMKRTARSLGQMDSHAAIGKIYELAGVDIYSCA